MCNCTVKQVEGLCIFEFSYGRIGEERELAFAFFLVTCAGVLIAVPDFKMLRFVDPFEITFSILRLLFFLCWVVIGLLTSTRFLYSPRPFVMSIGQYELNYDSGRPGLAYLLKTYKEQSIESWRGFFLRRKQWVFFRPEVLDAVRVDRENDNIIKIELSGSGAEFVIRAPDFITDELYGVVCEWMKTEPMIAVDHVETRLVRALQKIR